MMRTKRSALVGLLLAPAFLGGLVLHQEIEGAHREQGRHHCFDHPVGEEQEQSPRAGGQPGMDDERGRRLRSTPAGGGAGWP